MWGAPSLAPSTGYPDRAILDGDFGDLQASVLKNLPAVRETWVRPLCWEDPLEKGTATHSSVLAWRIPWTV